MRTTQKAPLFKMSQKQYIISLPSRSADGSGERVSALLQRGYDAPIGDVWDTLTQPDRIK
jgi:hypothetical protein